MRTTPSRTGTTMSRHLSWSVIACWPRRAPFSGCKASERIPDNSSRRSALYRILICWTYLRATAAPHARTASRCCWYRRSSWRDANSISKLHPMGEAYHIRPHCMFDRRLFNPILKPTPSLRQSLVRCEHAVVEVQTAAAYPSRWPAAGQRLNYKIASCGFHWDTDQPRPTSSEKISRATSRRPLRSAFVSYATTSNARDCRRGRATGPKRS